MVVLPQPEGPRKNSPGLIETLASSTAELPKSQHTFSRSIPALIASWSPSACCFAKVSSPGPVQNISPRGARCAAPDQAAEQAGTASPRPCGRSTVNLSARDREASASPGERPPGRMGRPGQADMPPHGEGTRLPGGRKLTRLYIIRIFPALGDEFGSLLRPPHSDFSAPVGRFQHSRRRFAPSVPPPWPPDWPERRRPVGGSLRRGDEFASSSVPSAFFAP